MHGWDTYDYGARGYYAAIGRWTSLDPLAEKYYSISPYAYVGNNPMNSLDLNGDSITVTQDALETILSGLNNANLNINVKNGMIDPESIKEQAENSDDLFFQDLYEIASNE